MRGVGLYGLVPLILLVGGIALAINHTWAVAALLIAMGVFGVWLITRYGDSGPMEPR